MPDELKRGELRDLIGRRNGQTVQGLIEGHLVTLRYSVHEDGTPAEVFAAMRSAGPAYQALLDLFLDAVTLALRAGVPLEVLVERYVFSRFAPNGAVEGHDRIKMCTSPVDFIFRELAVTLLGRNDLVHLPADAEVNTPPDDEGSSQPERPHLRSIDGGKSKE